MSWKNQGKTSKTPELKHDGPSVPHVPVKGKCSESVELLTSCKWKALSKSDRSIKNLVMKDLSQASSKSLKSPVKVSVGRRKGLIFQTFSELNGNLEARSGLKWLC